MAIPLRTESRKGLKAFFYELRKNKVLFLMLLPGMLFLLVNNYLPMFGVIIAFKNFKFIKSNFFSSLLASEWMSFKNFEFLFRTTDAFVITRNTLLYNAAFISIGLVVSIFLAVALNEIRSRKLAKFYQSVMFLPYFLSWVVASYLVFALLSVDKGLINRSILEPLGLYSVQYYSETRYWPFILIFMNTWKWAGYYSIIYLASIIGIDPELYSAATIDGANKWQQVTKITIPLLKPLMIILTLIQVGRIFYADFGLFYQVPRNTGMLYPVTSVIDTYVYNSLMVMGDIGMSSAAGLYQAVVGFLLVLGANLIVRKINPEYALF